MKRLVFVAALVVALLAAGAVAAFAAPGVPGRGLGHMGGMMGQGLSGMMGQGGYGHMGGQGMMGAGSMMGDDLEELLGIDHADIHAAHVAGKSLVEIASEKGVTEDQLIKALLDGRRAALDQAVKGRQLSQDAADQMLAFMEANIKAMVEAKGMSGMMGLMGGSGMMGGAGMMGRAPGMQGSGCHGGQGPSQQGTDVRDNVRLAPNWLQQS